MPNTNKKSGYFWMVMIITILRLPIAITFACVLNYAAKTDAETHSMILNNRAFFIGCLILLLLGELTDLLDGKLARGLNVTTEAGAMLDPYCDSVSRLIIYWSLASVGLVLPIVPLVLAVRDITMSYIRIILSKAGKSVKAKWSGKIKAFVQGVGTFIFLVQPFLWNWGLGKWTIAAGSWIIIIVTLVSVIEYAKAASKELNNLEPKNE